MWLYEQTTGRIIRDSIIGHGYSGCGEGKNSPGHQSIRNIGPIPCGVYRIGDPFNTKTHGPYVLALTPDVANQMFGRAGFLIHGDSVVEPGTASEGCIIQPRSIREEIYLSGDRMLEVVAVIGKETA